MFLALLAAACLPGHAAEPPARAAPVPPPGLVCLARLYGGEPMHDGSAWSLGFPGRPPLPWDDGRVKDPETRIADPDLQDTLVPAYPTGPITPVDDPAQDPGRARVEALFDARYGGTRSDVEAQLVTTAFLGQPVRVHPRVVDPLAAVSRRLEAAVAAAPALAPFVIGPLGGTFNWRVVANTGRRSAHSWGIAIDLVTAHTTYWEWDRAAGRPVRWTNQIPAAVVDAFEAEGFGWGGRWYHYDTMHFEYRPELFDPECRG